MLQVLNGLTNIKTNIKGAPVSRRPFNLNYLLND